MGTQNEAAWWDSQILTLLLIFATGESSVRTWTSRWGRLSHQQLPDPFPVLYSWELWKVLPPLLTHSGTPDSLPFPSQKSWQSQRFAVGSRGDKMEHAAELTACALLWQGSTQLPAISGKWLCFGIPRSVTVSAYSVKVGRGGKEA